MVIHGAGSFGHFQAKKFFVTAGLRSEDQAFSLEGMDVVLLHNSKFFFVKVIVLQVSQEQGHLLQG